MVYGKLTRRSHHHSRRHAMNQRNLRALLERLLVLPALVLCIGSPAAFAATIGDLGGTYHVSGSGDDATGDGSEANPWRTISHAFEEVGAYGPVIEVGEGDYDAAAGEVFPIDIDSAGTHGFTLSGPGDTVAGGTIIYVPGAYDDGNMMEAMVPLNGPILIENLHFAGVFSSSGSPLAGKGSLGSAHILDLNDDGEGEPLLPSAADVTMRNNNANYIGLYDAHSQQHATVLLSGNHVMNAESAAHIWMDTKSTDYDLVGDEPHSIGIQATITDNVVSYCSTAFALDADIEVPCSATFEVEISHNTVRNCARGVMISTSVSAEYGLVDHNAIIHITDNIFDSCSSHAILEEVELNSYFGSNPWEDPDAEKPESNRELVIARNTITATGDPWAIGLSWDFEDISAAANVSIVDNTITGGAKGIDYNARISAVGANDFQFEVLRNNISEQVSTAIVFSTTGSSHTDPLVNNHEFLIDGNAIHGNGAGIVLDHTHAYTATSNVNQTITRNHIYDNDREALYWYMRGWSIVMDQTVTLRGNVIEDNGGASWTGIMGGTVYRQLNFNEDWNDDTCTLAIDLGSGDQFGYNTIVEPEWVESLNSASVECFIRSDAGQGGHDKPLINGSVSMVGNWWGTQGAALIEGRVLHGADSSGFFSADLSNPLPDSLDFTAEYVDGVGIVVTAGADAGFVAYAGDLIMMGSLTGPEPGAGEIEASWVSEDFQTLTLPDPTGTAPAGDYEICLTNPGGQTGCASFTIEGDDDEDCSQNQIPTAVMDNAETTQGASVVIDLTANDSDHNDNMDPTAVTITQNPSQGTVVNNGDGTATYTPNGDEEQTTDTFNYTVSDTCGAISNIASCHIIIGGGDGGGGGGDNQIPTAVYDAAVTEMGASVDIDILANDSDSDGDALDTGSVVITQDPGKGSVVVNADGTVSYTPNDGVAATTDTFNYTVDDEHGATSNIATVEVSIQYGTDTTDITSGAGANAGGRTTQSARGGVGVGGTPTYGGTRTP